MAEIERKWLLRTVPMQPADRKFWVEQFYLSTEPEVRLRRYKCHGGSNDGHVFCMMTVKGEGTLVREEVETDVPIDFYDAVRDKIDSEPIQKHFLYYDMVGKSGYDVQISVVLNGKDSFVYAEVEFPTEKEARKYEFPWSDLVIKEITEDSNYKMKNLWKKINNK